SAPGRHRRGPGRRRVRRGDGSAGRSAATAGRADRRDRHGDGRRPVGAPRRATLSGRTEPMLRNADEYRAGLRDGRRVIYNGEPVADVTADPELRVAVDHSALCYDITELEPELAVSKDEDGEYSTFFHVPRTPEDLVRRGRLIEAVSRLGAGTIVLKEVGSDALFGLLRATTGEGLENAREFHRRCRDGDLALAVAQTDVKGDRTVPPHAQPDPDL